MYSTLTTLSILAILAGAQAAPRDGCGRRPHRPARPSYGVIPSSSENATVSSSAASSSSVENALPTSTELPASEVPTSVSETLTGVTSVDSAESASMTASATVVPAEPSVLSTPSSAEESSAISISIIGGELAVPTTPTIASSSLSAPAPTSSSVDTGLPPIDTVPTDVSVGLGVNGDTGPLTNFVGPDSKMGWYYNWALDSNSDSAGLQYVPMVWGEASVAGVKAASQRWEGVTHVLGFNEPDMGNNVGGSDITPTKAATLHQDWVTALGGETAPYYIGSPAVARGGQKWMDEWLVACADKCLFDFVPFHFYGTEVNQLIDYVEEFSATYNKPLWLTEWACHDYTTGEICDQAKVEAFMTTAIQYFRSSGLVERWAWFGAFPDMANGGNPNGIQNTDGSVNAVGELYLQL